MIKSKLNMKRESARLTLSKIKKPAIREYLLRTESISREILNEIKDYNLLINYRIKSTSDYYMISVKGYPSSIKRLIKERPLWLRNIVEDNIFETLEY